MNEPVRRLVAEDVSTRIAEDIAAFIAGAGPDLEAAHIALSAGAEPGALRALQALWADARQQRKVALIEPNQSSPRVLNQSSSRILNPTAVVAPAPLRRLKDVPEPAPSPFAALVKEYVEAKAAIARVEPKPEAKVSVEPEPEPTPAARVEPEPEPKARVEPEPEPEPEEEAEPVGPEPEPTAKVQLPAAIEALNAQHAIIDSVGGKTVIASWEPSLLDPSILKIEYQTKESFLLRYSNRFVTIDVPDGRGGFASRSQPMGQYWLGHRGRRQHRGVTFAPNGLPVTDNGCLNLWQGWGVEPKAGNWGLIYNHIVAIVADGDKESANYIIRWVAWAIQNPAKQAEVALVLIGEKGAGKGTLVRCLQRIFGAHAFQVTSKEEVIGRFNGHFQDCILFVADEAYWGGDKRCVGRLQGMITEPTLAIEPKNVNIFQVRNFLHVVMLAEPGWVIPAGRHERRYAALAVSDAVRGDRGYFKALHQQIEVGGAEAMFHDLQGMDLGDWHPREIPDALLKGSAMRKQQGHNLPAEEQWYMMLLHNGALPEPITGKPNKSLTSSLLRQAHANYPRLRNNLTEVSLRNFLIDEKRIGIACDKHRSASANGWSFPPLAECREAFDRLYGPIEWDHPEIQEWRGLLD